MLRTGEVGSSSFPRRITVAAVVAVVALVPVVGCGSPEPSPVESQTAKPRPKTPTSTPSPTPSKSASPTASGSVEDQLHAATIAFYAAVTAAYKELDPSHIEDVIVPGSRAGGFYLNDIQTVKSKSHHFADAPAYKIDDFKLEPADADPTNEVVTFKLAADLSEEVDKQGTTVEKFPAGTANGRIEFVRKGERWLVLSQRFDE